MQEDAEFKALSFCHIEIEIGGVADFSQNPTVSFDHCLRILDGCFENLSASIVNLGHVYEIRSLITLLDVITTKVTHLFGFQKRLPKLRLFSFISIWLTDRYDSTIVPLLRRTVNLEQLHLCVRVCRNMSTYIDGNQLYDQLLCYMTKLATFTFNIKTVLSPANPSARGSNEDIQHSLMERNYQVISGQTKLVVIDECCHIYTLLYGMLFGSRKFFSRWYVSESMKIENGWFQA